MFISEEDKKIFEILSNDLTFGKLWWYVEHKKQFYQHLIWGYFIWEYSGKILWIKFIFYKLISHLPFNLWFNSEAKILWNYPTVSTVLKYCKRKWCHITYNEYFDIEIWHHNWNKFLLNYEKEIIDYSNVEKKILINNLLIFK